MSEPDVIQGFLKVGAWGEADDILLLETSKPRWDKQPVAEILDEWISRKQVTVRYWIADQECTREEANEAFMRQVMGLAETSFGASYSEATGYLWTSEDAKVGGHDLIEEFRSHVGKYLILEIEIHDERKDA